MPCNLPALLLGLIVLTYWGRVVRMAWKARRRTGRAANFLPPEPLGRVLRVIWVPAVIIWVLHPGITGLVCDGPPIIRPLFDVPWLAWLGTAVAAACLLASLLCWRRMGKSWRMGIDPAEKTELVITGPYRYVRHPIYALSSLLMLATMLVVPSPLMLAAGVAHLLLLQWEARREERHLLLQHGQTYSRYCTHVGRFLPRLIGVQGSGFSEAANPPPDS
jgi:protein-S-isoprenylcysteine O-methyltransferase Ste14